MFGWLSGSKKEIERAKEEARKGFDSVKKDISAVSGWIKHLDSEKNLHKKEIADIKEDLASIMSELDGIKNVLSMMGNLNSQQVFKTPRKVFNKQTAVYPVQTGVQTGVQTPNLNQFSLAEKTIIWTLLNTDMKLSYDDLAALMNKERATIRGQINTLRQKSEGLIEEVIEKNGKKRVYIPEDIKEKLRKKTKVRVGRGEKE